MKTPSGAHLHAVAVVQQRRAARARSSATSATTAPTSRATTICSTARTRQIDRLEGRRVDERHRAAGPRVLRGDPREARAATRASRRCCPRCRCSTGSRGRSMPSIPVCMAPDPNTRTPKYKPPPGACDAHCHVFGPAIEISVRAGPQLHAARRAGRAASRAAEAPRALARGARARELPRRRQRR